jgi:uncharacterized protein
MIARAHRKKKMPKRANGALALAASMTKAERKARARKASMTRWHKAEAPPSLPPKAPKATSIKRASRQPKPPKADNPPADPAKAALRGQEPRHSGRDRFPKVPPGLIQRIKAMAEWKRSNPEEVHPYLQANVPPGVFPRGYKPEMAMDDAINQSLNWAASAWSMFDEGMMFLGYPYLSQLAQRSEYRRPAEIIATEMTRKWIVIQSKGGKDQKPEKDNDKKTAMDLAFGKGGPEDEDEDEPDEDEEEDEEEEDNPDQVKAKPPINGQPQQQEGGLTDQDEQAESDNDEQTFRIKLIEAEFERLHVRSAFKKLALYDGLFGRAHLYFDFFGASDDRTELQSSIGNGHDILTKLKVGRGSLQRLKVIEPIWTYPVRYNANDPLKPDWYHPEFWFVMGKQIHESRLLTFIGREVPDILKPAYNFGGLALSQLMKPYVDNWLRTRQSVSDLISKFSMNCLSTDLATLMGADGAQLMDRVNLFNQVGSNSGTMLLDKETEEWFNVSIPLGSLDHLQAQAQEQQAAPCGIPLVKLFGITPSGLNASTEGEIRVFYDWIGAYQEAFFRPGLTRVLELVQMSLFGEVDKDITFAFEPLWVLDEKGQADVRKVDADTDSVLIQSGVLDPSESRKRVASDPNAPYHDIDVDDVPEAPGMGEEDEGGLGGALGGGKPPGKKQDDGGEEEDDDENGAAPGKKKIAGAALPKPKEASTGGGGGEGASGASGFSHAA